ncbi:class II aldolase/adducin family protein [Pseudooceanicola marinus]|uniref:class II aldolase/adducin family protein n=1 Tax=Pseudooceanicola marinus TaxID=396013 RepID=UPI001C944554|nr:class II aldolase/adducin family protein [Pseudooceanicola marinus]MBY5974355.1 class II aldolase/adducin family protein [Ferrimonas balearica]MCA1337999.1 class II aldolase/adducin family protein [Pseudooceanicola marinus]
MTDQETKSAREIAIEELVIGTKILVNEGIMDVFGHISVRDPDNPEQFLLGQKLAPNWITTEDIQTLTLDGETTDNRPSYLERYIHSEIYKARPDVMCVLHTHSPEVLPYCFIDTPLRPVTHMGAFLGEAVPVYEIREKQGDDTDLFGGSPEVCAEIAEALGDFPAVIMARHGVVNVGNSIRETVFRAFYMEQEAKAHSIGMQIGNIKYLTPGEIESAGNLVGAQINRGWDHWSQRLKEAGLL